MRHLSRICVLLVILGSSWAPLRAEPAVKERLKTAHEAYRNKDVSLAAAGYEALLGEGYEDPVLHYNLGNCYFRMQAWHRAILHYEKALRLRPAWRDAAFNLQLARSRILDREEESLVNPFFAAGGWLMNRLSVDLWTLTGILSLTLISVVVLLSVLSLPAGCDSVLCVLRPWVFSVGIILLVLSAGRVAYFESVRHAVIFSGEARGLSGPAETFPVLFTVHKGTRVRLLGYEEGWVHVKLPHGFTGWLPAGSLEKI